MEDRTPQPTSLCTPSRAEVLTGFAPRTTLYITNEERAQRLAVRREWERRNAEPYPPLADYRNGDDTTPQAVPVPQPVDQPIPWPWPVPSMRR
jgi:hypothetical protein